MKVFISVLSLVLTATSLATSASADERMSSADVKTAISGKTVIGATASGVGYETTFAADGSVNVDTDGYGSDTGKWHVTKDGRMCATYERFYDGLERCVWFEKAANANGLKAYIEGTNEPTFFRFKN